MTRQANIIEAAAIAYRAACNGEGAVTYGRKFDARVNWDGQRVEVTDEIGTVNVGMLDEDFNAKVRELGRR